jgi:hypothetical protein
MTYTSAVVAAERVDTQQTSIWRRTIAVAALAIAALCLSGMAVDAAWAQSGRTAHVLTTSGTILTIDLDGTQLASAPVTGVTAGETLVGIEIRPQNAMVYAVGVNAVTETVSLYLLSWRTGVATVIGGGNIAFPADLPDPATARFGLAFDPSTDRLRVTTSRTGAGPGTAGFNFRMNPNDGTLTAVDAPINPASISIDEIAHTDQWYMESSALVTISAAEDALYIQTPVNDGTQSFKQPLSTPVTAVLGLDVNPDIAAFGGLEFLSGAAYAIVTTAEGTGLTTIEISSGQVGALTPIAGGVTDVRGFAVHDASQIDIMPAFALSSNGSSLIRFTTYFGEVRTRTIGGIQAGDVLVGLDLRPQTGQLYALGFNAVANTTQLYLIDPQSAPNAATATAAGAPVALTLPGATSFGIDFNPTVDRIRVVTSAGENFRLNPNTGTIVGLDTAINPVGRVVTSVAYTNNFGQPLIGGATTLYALDAANDTLSIQDSPNGGTQTHVLPITFNGAPLDFTAVSGFDIPGNLRVTTSNAIATGWGYAGLTVGGQTSLYRIELSTGAVIGGGVINGGGDSIAGLTLGDLPVYATRTTLTVEPAHVPAGTTVTLTATVGHLYGNVTFFIDGVAVGQAPLQFGPGTATLTVNSSAFTEGSHQVTATFDGSAFFVSSTTAAPSTLKVGQFAQHFAEGATGFFQTDIGILNASSDTDANIIVRLFPEGAAPVVQQFVLTPLARRSLDVNAILEAAGFAGSVSTLIESNQPIAATRQMTWGTPVYGSTLESGMPDTSPSWYFAEGATSIFSLFYLIENPAGAPADVTFTHLLEGGGAPVVQHETVAAQSRRTFYINDVPGIAGASLSTTIQSSVPVVAERAMYLNTTARQWEGGHASAGATAPSRFWSLAEGATGFFHTYLLLGNPGTTEAEAKVVYRLPAGGFTTGTYRLAPQSRRTVDVGAEIPLLENATFSMSVTSDEPIVAERAMWWGLPFYEGSVAFGSTATGTAWAIGEGIEGGANGDATFVLVSNNVGPANLRITVAYDDGTRQDKDYAMPAGRLTVRIGTDFPESAEKKFSVLVRSLPGPAPDNTPAVPITVEYARYQSMNGFLDGGGAALATKVQ